MTGDILYAKTPASGTITRWHRIKSEENGIFETYCGRLMKVRQGVQRAEGKNDFGVNMCFMCKRKEDKKQKLLDSY
jgi:hypothetical protein